MNRPRFHVTLPAAASPGLTVEFSTGESHHAMHVLRLSAGDEVELFDGRGVAAVARIASARHGTVTASVTVLLLPRQRPRPRIHLAFAVPKGKRLDWLLEKATELGAASLRPVIFERSVAGTDDLTEGKQQRWLGHCIAAAKQCGLDFLPEILDPLPLQQWLATPDVQSTLKLVGDAGEASRPLAQALAGHGEHQEVALAVGPEGGLTPEELSILDANNFTRVRLGSTILRVETAAVALLAGVTGVW